MDNTSQTQFNQSPEPLDSASPGNSDWPEAVFARLPAIYFLLGIVLLVLSAQYPLRIGSAGIGLAIAGGLCFVASAIAHRSR